MKKKGTIIVPIDSAGAGDIISMAGLASPSIGHTVANVEVYECNLYCFTESFIFSVFFFSHLARHEAPTSYFEVIDSFC
jgi:predicted membrane GTPase involved in stress response